MKNFLNKIISKIVKYKKKLIYGFLAMIFGQIFLFNIGGVGLQGSVYATNDSSAQNKTFQEIASEKIKDVSIWINVMYMLLYPFLFLAGNLVDNSFVYGEIFNFDVILWKLWNITKNLANFTLGFLFIYNIFKMLWDGDSEKKIKDLLVHSLIAGLGIQASWFVFAALIDVSTIATYGLGGLPISATQTSGENGIAKMFGEAWVPKTLFESDLTTSNIHIFLSNTSGDKLYSECEVMLLNMSCYSGGKVSCEVSSGSNTFLVGPNRISYEGGIGNDYKPTVKNACHYEGQIYYFTNNLYGDIDNSKYWGGETGHQTEYTNKMNTVKSTLSSDLDKSKEAGNKGKIIQYGTQYTGSVNFGMDLNNAKNGSGNFVKLGDLFDNSKSYLGAFSALYSSLMNTASGGFINSGGNNSVYMNLLEFLLKVLHIAALFIPLAAMVVLLLMRIFIIWIAIIISPFIVLLKAFDMDKKFEGNDILKHMTVKNLIGIIFSPVVICLAVSLSVVIVTILTSQMFNTITTENLNFGNLFGGLITLDISGFAINTAKLFVAFFGAAITWFLVWAAVSWSSLGETTIMKGLKQMAETAVGSVPIVPVLTRDKEGKLTTETVGIGAAFGDNGVISRTASQLETKFNSKGQSAVENFMKEFDSETISVGGVNLKVGGSSKRDKRDSFANLDDVAKKKVIDNINSLDKKDENKERLTSECKSVVIGEKIYEYNETTGHYEEKTEDNSGKKDDPDKNNGNSSN